MLKKYYCLAFVDYRIYTFITKSQLELADFYPLAYFCYYNNISLFTISLLKISC